MHSILGVSSGDLLLELSVSLHSGLQEHSKRRSC